MHLLGISPEFAQARDVRRIGAAYREELGFLDAGQPTPQLTKLVDEGLLTPDELEKLRKGAPMAMGGQALSDNELREQLRALKEERDAANEESLGEIVRYLTEVRGISESDAYTFAEHAEISPVASKSHSPKDGKP